MYLVILFKELRGRSCRVRPTCPMPPPLILLDVQGRVINLQVERARSGHCITICLLHQGVGKNFAWRDLPLHSSCWNVTPSKLSLHLSVNMPVFVFASPQYRFLVIRAGVHQQLAAYLLACLRHSASLVGAHVAMMVPGGQIHMRSTQPP